MIPNNHVRFAFDICWCFNGYAPPEFSFVIFICLLEQRPFCISFFEMASARSYKIGVVGNIWLVDKTVFSERALIFYMKLGDYKGRKVTELDFWKKLLIWRYSRKVLQISVSGWLVGNTVFSETALRIFLIFCMKLRAYKGRKVTEPDFWKKFLI